MPGAYPRQHLAVARNGLLVSQRQRLLVLEIRTVAGPSRHVQCVLSGGPYTVWSHDGPRVTPLPNCGVDHIAAPGSWLIPANQRAISASGINGLTSLLNQLDRYEEDQAGR
jgi:hypothetical protein